MATRVRPATRADAEEVGEVLAEAFEDHPWIRWAFGERPSRDRLAALYRLDAGVAGAERRATWVAEQDGAVVAAACWTRPDAPELSPATEELLSTQVPRLIGDRAERLAEADDCVARLLPAERHWFLGCVGTRPRWRGRGLATSLVAAGLADVDAQGAIAVLETSSAANVRLYERLGFVVRAELDPPGGAPHVWLMERPAAGGRGETAEAQVERRAVDGAAGQVRALEQRR
ncbi:GNAT family N-acetyltransferase [Geodermatophilus marinus]|uniref:GNAT family N-acetyltransferase n=1 Tax=Geodermatophilus sp. LHW52908 TaxID=2303986 RepID=UPI0011C1519C|nr:GNAT family N-acetyltransferase [Geodermatophilus sp. LHW52908]